MLSHTEYESQLNTAFRVQHEDGGAFELCLVEVRLMGSQPGGKTRAPFALLFRASKEERLPQKIYRLRHAALGELDIFLVPVAGDADGYYLEAVFN